jgi:hypothetical protein
LNLIISKVTRPNRMLIDSTTCNRTPCGYPQQTLSLACQLRVCCCLHTDIKASAGSCDYKHRIQKVQHTLWWPQKSCVLLILSQRSWYDDITGHQQTHNKRTNSSQANITHSMASLANHYFNIGSFKRRRHISAF